MRKHVTTRGSDREASECERLVLVLGDNPSEHVHLAFPLDVPTLYRASQDSANTSRIRDPAPSTNCPWASTRAIAVSCFCSIEGAVP